ncbi:hypothetical protein HLB44_10645 [Aquincola sp. S2]|uniref:Cell envelope protein SmpA n=1 Tax=Pseudaquabacterium terrae TaxID=2732868 RepID=A0ABX2EFN9_9BURK|nr:hypothetical protein [Aquabacterium terrae]NRF67443.1 hypothetical protein [Aquabacterium terrae]
MRFHLAAAGVLAVLAMPFAASAQPTPEGYLCCNLRTDGKWISDSNYMESGKRVIPLGTAAKVTGYGRFRAFVDLGDNSKQALGNDYSRDLEMSAFATRYVVAEDPKKKLAALPPKLREAITSGRLAVGMSRDQVVMAVGYPITSENPRLDAKVLRFWLSSFQEFQVVFDDKGSVKEIVTFDPATRHAVVME